MKLRQRLKIRRFARQAWIDGEFEVRGAKKFFTKDLKQEFDPIDFRCAKRLAMLFWKFWEEMGIEVPDSVVQVGEPIEADVE